MPTVHDLAGAYGLLVGQSHERVRGLRVFRTSMVVDPPPRGGTLRVATREDLALMTDWCRGFAQDIGEEPGSAVQAKLIIAEARAHIWTDESAHPRAMCAWSGPTPNGIRISLVYTPPEYRGRGYASNATAELTRRLLRGGRQFVFLFTDADNPTSNRIYQRIGYRQVADFEQVRFIAHNAPSPSERKSE